MSITFSIFIWTTRDFIIAAMHAFVLSLFSEIGKSKRSLLLSNELGKTHTISEDFAKNTRSIIEVLL